MRPLALNMRISLYSVTLGRSRAGCEGTAASRPWRRCWSGTDDVRHEAFRISLALHPRVDDVAGLHERARRDFDEQRLQAQSALEGIPDGDQGAGIRARFTTTECEARRLDREALLRPGVRGENIDEARGVGEIEIAR